MKDDLFRDYHVRMQNIAPLIALLSRIHVSKKYQDRFPDMLSLVLSSLLYLYDGMLLGRYRSPEQLADFLSDYIAATYKQVLSQTETDEITNYILYDILQKEGPEAGHSFIEPMTGQAKSVQVQFLDMPSFANKTTATYRLTDQSLWFLYITKEYLQEVQISIKQLFIRQNLERGNYDHTLSIIDELMLWVQRFQAQLDKIEAKILADALSIEEGELQSLDKQIFSHFEEEKREFQAQLTMVTESIDKVKNTDFLKLKKVDSEALQKLQKIKRALRRTTQEHNKLFESRSNLRRTYQEALSSRVVAASIGKQVDFTADVLHKIIQSNADIEGARRGLHFLFHSPKSSFNPLMKIVEPWYLLKRGEDSDSRTKLDAIVDDEWIEKESVSERYRMERYKYYLGLVLHSLQGRQSIRLSEIVGSLSEAESRALFAEPEFYSFFFALHQAGTIDIKELYDNRHTAIRHDDNSTAFELLLVEALEEHPKLLEQRYLVVLALDERGERKVLMFEHQEFTDFTIHHVSAEEEVFLDYGRRSSKSM